MARRQLAASRNGKPRFDGLMLAELRNDRSRDGDDPGKVALTRWTIHDLRRTRGP